MAKSASISMRVNPQIKAEAESIYGSLGMTLTEAINIFLHKSILEAGCLSTFGSRGTTARPKRRYTKPAIFL